jgi:hypothetical protein
VKEHLKANWKKYALTAATLAAGWYGGPAGSTAVEEYLPKIAAALGLL